MIELRKGRSMVILSFLDPSWTQWVAVPYVMFAQAFSGIAKDLTKMSSKSAIRRVVPKMPNHPYSNGWRC